MSLQEEYLQLIGGLKEHLLGAAQKKKWTTSTDLDKKAPNRSDYRQATPKQEARETLLPPAPKQPVPPKSLKSAPPPVKREAPPPPAQKESGVKFPLFPKEPAAPLDLSDIKKAMQALFPQVLVMDEVPHPVEPSFYLLAPKVTTPLLKAFLGHLLKAVNVQFGPCLLVTSRPRSESPIISLPEDLTLYLREPVRKAELWKALCEQLQKQA